MDDPYPVSAGQHATWQSDAERQSDHGPPRWRRSLQIAIAAIVVLVAVGAAIGWWLNARHFSSTDDAFVDGYVTQTAPQVAGRVIALRFADNEHVTAGQTLVLIDPRDYQVKLDQANAQHANAVAGLRQAEAQVGVAQANLDQARANVSVAEADREQAQKDYERFTSIDPHAVSRQQVDNATAANQSARAKLDAARQAVRGDEAQLEAGHAQVVAAQAQVQQAEANVAAAELQLSYCAFVAPVTGRIAHRNVDVGNYVNTGQPMFAIVQDEHWVTANFKETQLAGMQVGQPVDIDIDAVPSVTFHGHVDSFFNRAPARFSACCRRRTPPATT